LADHNLNVRDFMHALTEDESPSPPKGLSQKIVDMLKPPALTSNALQETIFRSMTFLRQHIQTSQPEEAAINVAEAWLEWAARFPHERWHTIDEAWNSFAADKNFTLQTIDLTICRHRMKKLRQWVRCRKCDNTSLMLSKSTVKLLPSE
jgi:hypothetical protein